MTTKIIFNVGDEVLPSELGEQAIVAHGVPDVSTGIVRSVHEKQGKIGVRWFGYGGPYIRYYYANQLELHNPYPKINDDN